jgi:hypothetical protein
MPRKYFGDGQEIVKDDLNNLSAAIMREFNDRALYEMLQRTSDAFFGDSFKPTYLGPTSIQLAAGLGFQDDTSAVSPEPSKKPLYLAEAETVNLSPPDAADDRIDIVCVKWELANEISATRKYKNPSTSVISNESMVIQKEYQAEILVVDGTPAATPVAPATPTGYLKIATCAVAAVSGMSGASDVTDERDLMPVAGEILLNTLGYNRLTAGASTSISNLLSDIDDLLKNGHMEYLDLDELGAAPSSPGATKRRIYVKDGTLYQKDSAGTITPIGSGSGGGGVNWYEPEGLAPISSEENSQRVYMFQQAGSDKLILWLKVPSSYLSGRQIRMKLGPTVRAPQTTSS